MQSPGRNDPCPCGSGRKFKKCCLNRVPIIGDRTVADAETFTPPPGFTAVQLFEDPTPNAVINQRLVLSILHLLTTYTDLSEPEKGHVTDLLVLIARKLASVWKHLEQYRIEEDRLIAKFRNAPSTPHVQRDASQVLFSEFDEFTVQIKSTLDHLVKVMVPILGRNKWSLRTFEKKGEGVLKALKRNTGTANVGRVRSMEVILFEKRGWLEAVISARDRVNHYMDGGIDIHVFSVLRQPNGDVEVPMWSPQQTLRAAMEGFWSALFCFVEDFVVLALNFRMPADKYGLMRLQQPVDKTTSSWAVVPASVTRAMSQSGHARPV